MPFASRSLQGRSIRGRYSAPIHRRLCYTGSGKSSQRTRKGQLGRVSDEYMLPADERTFTMHAKRGMTMPRGYALLVGLKSVNPAAYGGWNGKNGCFGCELDVDNIRLILDSMGYEVSVQKTTEATSLNVLQGLRSAARAMKDGDIFVFYYSGHGGQQPDYSGDESTDGYDETLVLYDREVIDDELDKIWKSFRPRVRIVMISDSCNSGSNYRGVRDVAQVEARPMLVRSSDEIRAQMIHYSGCRDGGESIGYRTGGVFTMAFCSALANGADTYPSLYNDARKLVKTQQEPQYNKYGDVHPYFEHSQPFSIDTVNVPMRDEIRSGLTCIPVSWLHKPVSAQNSANGTQSFRVGPFAAAVIGVAVGAGIQLGSQAIKGLDSRREALGLESVVCDLSLSEIEDLALFFAAGMTPSQIGRLAEGSDSHDRAFPVAVAAFLAGVAAGSNAAR